MPIFKQMEKSSGKTVYKSMYYFEPINKYQKLSFTDIKDLLIEKEHFIDIFLINKYQHKMTINVALIGFMNQKITFKQHKEEMYQTNWIDLFSALYHLTYENENDINEILNIQENKTIEQVATFERKPKIKCKFYINKYTESEKEFNQMFDFYLSHLTQKEFEKIVTIILEYKQVYATPKFDVGKTKVKIESTYEKRCNFQKTKNKQTTNTPQRKNPKITRCIEKIRHNCTCY